MKTHKYATLIASITLLKMLTYPTFASDINTLDETATRPLLPPQHSRPQAPPLNLDELTFFVERTQEPATNAAPSPIPTAPLTTRTETKEQEWARIQRQRRQESARIQHKKHLERHQQICLNNYKTAFSKLKQHQESETKENDRARSLQKEKELKETLQRCKTKYLESPGVFNTKRQMLPLRRTTGGIWHMVPETKRAP